MISPDISDQITTRTVSADPGLLSNEELLRQNGKRRRSLEKLIAIEKQNTRSFSPAIFDRPRKHVRWFIDHARLRISYNDVMVATTTFVLFGDDLRILLFPPAADSAFATLTRISFLLFIIEMILYCWAKSEFSEGIFNVKGYAFSFIFWLDLIAVVSMVPDVDWFSSGLGTRRSFVDDAEAKKEGESNAQSNRVVMMARLVRLVKLYKVTYQRTNEKQRLDDVKNLAEFTHSNHSETQDCLDKTSIQKQSKLGAELSDIITRRVVIAVISMICAVALLTYTSSVDDERGAILFLHNINIHAGFDCEYLKRSIEKFQSFMDNIEGQGSFEEPYLVSLTVNPARCESIFDLHFNKAKIDEVRDEALRRITTDPVTVDGLLYSVSALFNLTSHMKKQSLSSIYLMIFVIVMLLVLSTQFRGDAQRLVLAPIENMMAIVNRVAADPLYVFDFKDVPGKGDYETHVIQMAIEKITALLRIGFGVAGAEIISSNIAVEGVGNAGLNPMIPGKRVYAIFGFCDIMSFDFYTEKLEDEIMTFVNSVARIVHSEVTRWGGTCNKNLGNAFLMVWRIGDEKSLLDSKSNQPSTVDLRRIPGLDVLSDKALIGFLKVIVEINRDEQLLSYRNDARLSSEFEKGFLLRMGFGLHAGWAIEGAVGSLHKVDATYLSPHVNMAARLEAATRQFGVPILMSRSFFNLLSETVRIYCRKVDVVAVKGSNVPMPIYTHDLLQTQLFPRLRAPKFSTLSVDEILTQKADNYDLSTWMSDPDLVQLRCLVTPEFSITFAKGLKSYLAGHWDAARECLEKVDKMMALNDIGGDGPSQAILKYMKDYNFVSPSSWSGCRPLTSK